MVIPCKLLLGNRLAAVGCCHEGFMGLSPTEDVRSEFGLGQAPASNVTLTH